MTVLLSKSGFNMLAAESLIKNNLHASSVHCSYYSCVQLMLHILFTKMGISEQEMEATLFKSKEGKHAYLIKNFVSDLNSKDKKEDSRTFNNNIVQLKVLRVNADYKQMQIDGAVSNSAMRLGKNIAQFLKKTYSIV